ncbi:MAG: DUF2927 domain-containing protein [Symploca sp. SIO2B6]|nr:DUF2927 domain-containing protein [Symploca sp. SIO2B6]
MSNVILDTFNKTIGRRFKSSIQTYKKNIALLSGTVFVSMVSFSSSVAIATPNQTQTLRTSANSVAYHPPSYPSAEEQIDYFLEIAMGSEYGNASSRIRKWDSDLYIHVQGDPTAQDLTSLQTIVTELNGLIDTVDLHILDDSPRSRRRANVTMHFVPVTEFSQHVPEYHPGNLGYAWVWWQDNTIYDATILISTDNVTQQERTHLIREELTQSLGLLQDSFRYEDSIFFQQWTSTAAYSDLDQAIIKMLYHPAIEPGMSRRRVLNTLNDYPELIASRSTPGQ